MSPTNARHRRAHVSIYLCIYTYKTLVYFANKKDLLYIYLYIFVSIAIDKLYMRKIALFFPEPLALCTITNFR